MLSYDKSQELMLAKEAGYIDTLKEVPGVTAEVLAAMSSLYRAGWRDCWMEEAKTRLCVVLDTAPAYKEGNTDDVR
jgi:hypothetical protein